MPATWLVSKAYWRHSSLTGHTAHTALALSTVAALASLPGKKALLEYPAQAARSLQLATSVVAVSGP